MFTGLIEEVGDVVIVRAHERGTELQIAAPVIAKQVSRGESIAVNGCCLTLTSRSRDRLSFDLTGGNHRSHKSPGSATGQPGESGTRIAR